MTGKFYQLYDVDNIEWGLLCSEDKNLTIDVLEKLWESYYTENLPEDDPWLQANENYIDNIGLDNFTAFLESRGYNAEGIYVENIFI